MTSDGKLEQVFWDSPAFRAGLKSGDLITRIDDSAVRGMTIDQAVKKMRGKPKTSIRLTIFRPGRDDRATIGEYGQHVLVDRES